MLWAVIAFVALVLPGAIDAWWSLATKISESGMPELGDVFPRLIANAWEAWSLVSGPLGLLLLAYIAWGVHRKQSSSGKRTAEPEPEHLARDEAAQEIAPQEQAGSPRLSIDWAPPPQPDELNIHWINSENHPLEHLKTEVTSLCLWARGEYRRDSKPQKVYVVGDLTVDPQPHRSPQRTLVKAKSKHQFEIHSGRTPHQKVSRDAEGTWKIILETSDSTGRWKTTNALFFSWHRDRDRPLQIEQDPEGRGQ
jgi:hypothetical protein